MKGKGKFKSEVKVKSEPLDDSLSKPPELTIADVDNCPTYMSAVQKDGGRVAVKDLISLQHELEYMNNCLIRRQQQLKTEIESVENPAARKNKRSRSTDSVGKKSEKKSKKCKGKSSTPSRSKNKFIQPPPTSYECGVTDAQVEIPKLQKNDGPSRFWSFIEPYCADITQDDIKSIEAWIKTHDDDEEYQKIPKLGNHFAEKWTKHDMDEEVKEGSKSAENQKGISGSDPSDKERIIRMGEDECKQLELLASSSKNNSLAQRLVSTYVQENVMTAFDVSLTETAKDGSSTSSKKKLSVSSSPSKASLQKRLCKDLSEIGAMEAQQSNDDDHSTDEILLELKRLQKALIPVCNRNLRQKKHLLALANLEMKKQDATKKLKEIDAKVMEIYRAIYAALCERKPPPKKYTAQIKETLAKRQKVIKELDDMS